MKTLSSVGGRPCSRATRSLSSLGCALDDQAALVEDRESVAEAVGLGEVVRGEHDRRVVGRRAAPR